MRRVLVVSPNFPPADAPDMHRVRMTLGHYRACGWDPVVLCVRAEDTGRLIDPTLTHTVPSDIRVEPVAAPGKLAHRLAGINDLGLRAGGALFRAGSALLEREKFDLVFISTTQFTAMPLGARWKQRFGVPFVLDFQDPWASFPESGKAFFRKGLRHEAMRWLHRRQEARTVPQAGGLIAVSQTYIDLLRLAYPVIANRPALASPFGFSHADFVAAERYGEVFPAVAAAKSDGDIVCLFAGRVAPTMERALAHLFAVISAGRAAGHPVFDRLRLAFVGTGYSSRSNERLASALATAAGLADRLVEAPERISLLDAWKTTLAADVLLILGSEDTGFTPSKKNALLSLKKPIICAAPAQSIVWREIAEMETIVGISPDVGADVADLARRLAGLLDGGGDYRPRIDYAKRHEALPCARRECGLFDQVVAQASA